MAEGAGLEPASPKTPIFKTGFWVWFYLVLLGLCWFYLVGCFLGLVLLGSSWSMLVEICTIYAQFWGPELHAMSSTASIS